MTTIKPLQSISQSELQAQLEQTEASLSELKAELRRRSEADQHAAVDHLADYMRETHSSLSVLRHHVMVLLEAIRKDIAHE